MPPDTLSRIATARLGERPFLHYPTGLDAEPARQARRLRRGLALLVAVGVVLVGLAVALS